MLNTKSTEAIVKEGEVSPCQARKSALSLRTLVECPLTFIREIVRFLSVIHDLMRDQI